MRSFHVIFVPVSALHLFEESLLELIYIYSTIGSGKFNREISEEQSALGRCTSGQFNFRPVEYVVFSVLED